MNQQKPIFRKILLFFILNLSAVCYAQRTCATDELASLQNKNLQTQETRKQIETHTRRSLLQSRSFQNQEVLTIPVVVHIVYNKDKENISDAQVQSQIDVLNEDFRACNSNLNNVPKEFTPADVGIEFNLVQTTRTQSSKRKWNYKNDDVKKTSEGGIDPIEPSKNLNIWVCNLNTLGYAQFPGGALETDGVVINTKYFGSIDKGTGFYLGDLFEVKGRTATHEIGHYLNLNHIWGGEKGCNTDDGVNDTPIAYGSYFGCPSYPSASCNSNDQFMNYMDFVDDACMFLFTAGQKARMRVLFEPGGSRELLPVSPQTLYLQNTTVLTEETLQTKGDIEAGYNVTNSLSQGNYQLFNGSSLSLQAGTRIRLQSGFRALEGAFFRAYIEGCHTHLDNSRAIHTIADENTSITQSIPIKEVENKESKADIVLYPNPTTDWVEIYSNVPVIKYILSDYWGKPLKLGTMNGNTLRINLSHFSTGLYIIQLETTTGIFIKKKIIKH